jgi:hypothetical protein
VQQGSGKTANVAVVIAERSEQLLVRGQIPVGEPLQMANK